MGTPNQSGRRYPNPYQLIMQANSLIRLVFCTDGIYPQATGGMQKHSRLLIESLAQTGRVLITVLHPHSGPVFNHPAIQEISIAPISEKNNYLLECYRYSRRVGEQLLNLEYDVIYSQGLSVWWNIRSFSQKLIINPHGLEPYQSIGFKNNCLAIPFRLIFNFLFNRAAAVISLGGKLTTILQKEMKHPNRIQVIANGVKIPEEDPPRTPDASITRVLFLARFASNKGIDVLFKAIDNIAQKGLLHKFEFILGGKGPLYEHYLQTNRHKEVKLLGFVKDEDINGLYRTSDLFVLPTLFEGMPTVVLEAMSWQLPIIVSDVGATAEQVSAANGYLIQPGNADELTNSLLKFLELAPEQKESMGLASYELVKEKFTWEVISRKHLQLFERFV